MGKSSVIQWPQENLEKKHMRLGRAKVEWGQFLGVPQVFEVIELMHPLASSSAACIESSAYEGVSLCIHYGCIDLVLIAVFSLIPSWTFQTKARCSRRLVKEFLSQSEVTIGAGLASSFFSKVTLSALIFWHWHWHSPEKPIQLDKEALGDHFCLTWTLGRERIKETKWSDSDTMHLYVEKWKFGEARQKNPKKKV